MQDANLIEGRELRETLLNANATIGRGLREALLNAKATPGRELRETLPSANATPGRELECRTRTCVSSSASLLCLDSGFARAW